MTAPPAKIKASVASIKEQYLDDDGATSLSSDEIFAVILKMELLLRGVMVQDDTKLWTQIQASVGKNLLTDLPKPLMARMNVVAGRLVEKLYQQLQLPTTYPDRSTIVPRDQADGAIQRAKDIEDERWLILFSPDHKSDNDILQIALGYFSSAAQIQSDTPAMWKKVWDTWTLLREPEATDDTDTNIPPFEAATAIENLIRIANSKGNAKRAFELKLRLVQSYLNADRVVLATISTQTKKKDLPKTILDCFGGVGAGLAGNKMDPVKTTNTAVSVLKECQPYFEQQSNDSSIPAPETLLYRTLWVQSLVLKQDAEIRKDAQEMYELSKNRAPGKTTLDDCIKKCRDSFLVPSEKDSTKCFETVMFLSASITLRDTMVAVWGGSEELKKDLSSAASEKSLCFHWVEQSALRLKECASIISHKTKAYCSSWKVVLDYTLPVLEEMERQSALTSAEQWLQQELDESSEGLSKTTLISCVVSMLPDIYWMMLGDDDTTPEPMDSHMLFAKAILTVLIQKQEVVNQTEQNQSKASSAIGTGAISEGFLKVQTWEHAKDVALCFICQDDPSLTHQITEGAISSSKRKDIKEPLGLLRCLVAWAGWYQRPWPYCASLGDTRRILSCARTGQARPLTKMELLLLDMASADAELLNGGFADKALQKYSEILAGLERMKGTTDSSALALLQTHCYNGLAQASQILGQREDEESSEDPFTKLALSTLGTVDLTIPKSQLFVWHLQKTFSASKSHQMNTTRQLTADLLVAQGRSEEARSFLEAAVADSPTDAEAALAFGAFLLRMCLYVKQDNDASEEKAAQIQLLKAAKLDPTKSDPFSLLGLWFEHRGDTQRALGCFKKSLVLDPCDPVAGRGILRLQDKESLQDVLDDAIERTSTSNGWAWYAVGKNKSYAEGNDDLAVIAMLKGLRCRDVAQPISEKFGLFFFRPSEKLSQNEESAALADVAACYRRLGRFTASIRAFHASIASAGDQVPSQVLISCAQVELELGLFDDAAGSFSRVLERGEDPIASHGLATVLCAMAHRDLVDGKAGAALKRTEAAIESCLKSSIKFGCQQKLLGDLYTFGAQLPPNVFAENGTTTLDLETCLKNQLDFVAKGEEPYQRCADIHLNAMFSNEEEIGLKSCIVCDLAVNYLMQAQLLSVLSDNNDDSTQQKVLSTKVEDMYRRAADAFRLILEENPIHAPSWSGYGIAILRNDPLLAQHAFCRSIELDKLFPDAYANLGFLYTSLRSLDPSRDTMEALTQVADTPMMWMNCAYILEQEAARRISDGQKNLEGIMTQVSDAYRASLQVTKNPAAHLGLSLTSRVAKFEGSGKDRGTQTCRRKNAFLLMKEYVGASFVSARSASLFQGMMNMEKGIEGPNDAQWRDMVVAEGKDTLKGSAQDEIDGVHISSLSKVLEICDAPAAASVKEPNLTPTDSTLESIQKAILFNPELAELWMSLAKEAVSKDEIEFASEAASRASLMLSNQLLDRGVSSTVNASMFSEAIALDSWLKELSSTVENANESVSFAMQRALLMDPENAIARQGLCS